jgi:hypothetical protein
MRVADERTATATPNVIGFGGTGNFEYPNQVTTVAYVVTLVYNDVNKPNKEILINSGETPDIGSEKPVWEGYKLSCWYVDKELTVAYVPGPVTGDISLYAKYDELMLIDTGDTVKAEFRNEGDTFLPTS